MSGTRTELKRALQARVDGLAAVEIRPGLAMGADIYAQPADGTDFSVLADRISQALRHFGVAGVGYAVKPFPPPDSPEPPTHQGRFFLATLDSQCTVAGLAQSLARLVPSLARVVIDEEPGKIVVRVAPDDGQPFQPLRDQVARALAAIAFEGLKYEVVAFDAADKRGDVSRLGILLPKRNAELTALTEEEHETFATRIKRLVSGQADAIPLLDEFAGSKVVCTSALAQAAPLSCFLPLYDRVYAILPPAPGSSGDYFEQTFGLKESEFLTFCRRGKVVPVFKFALGTYPEAVIKTFLRDATIPRITGRELDYIAARYAWKQASFARILREDRTATRRIFELCAEARKTRTKDMNARLIQGLMDDLLYIAENFEGLMWNRGHLGLALLSPAMPAANIVSALPNGDAATMAQIDTNTAGIHLALAQAFDASLHTGLVTNWPVMEFVSRFFQPHVQTIDPAAQQQLKSLLSGLEIAYNDSIPADQYSDIFDQTETERMRRLLTDITRNGDDKAKIEEVQGRLQKYNEGVRKMAGYALRMSNAESEAEVLGDAFRVAGLATGHTVLLEGMAKLLDRPLIAQATAKTIGGVLDSASVGAVIDGLRGAVNQVPQQSVRLFRLRRKLGRV